MSNRNSLKRFCILFSGVSAAASLAAACGSSDPVHQVMNQGGEAGQGAGAPAANAGGSSAAAGPAAGEGGVPVTVAGSGGTTATSGAGGAEGGAPSEAGATSQAGQAGASTDAGAGAGGAPNECEDCVDVAGSLSGLLWKLPCTTQHVNISCSSAPAVTVTGTVGGTPGVTYDVTVRFRGVVERKNYVGGCSDGAFWQSGGADNGDIGNVYELRVSSPPQDYFLNVGSGTIDVTTALDYVKTIRADAGATVTLYAASKDNAELFNRDATSTPISISGTSVEQPYDGQFIQMDVESVTPSAIGWNAVIGGGSSGSALSFSGTQLATVPDSATLQPSSLTQEAWFRFQGPTGVYNAIFGKPVGGGIGDSYTLWVESGTLRGVVGATNSPYISQPWSDTTQWHHAAFTYDAQAMKQTLYVDGAVVACAPASGAIGYDTHPLMLGADSDNGTLSGFWNGSLDEVRLFSTARTADQIWTDLHTHQLGPTAGLVAEWTFDEATGQDLTDSSGNNQTGVLGTTNAVEASDPTRVVGR